MSIKLSTEDHKFVRIIKDEEPTNNFYILLGNKPVNGLAGILNSISLMLITDEGRSNLFLDTSANLLGEDGKTLVINIEDPDSGVIIENSVARIQYMYEEVLGSLGSLEPTEDTVSGSTTN